MKTYDGLDNSVQAAYGSGATANAGAVAMLYDTASLAGASFDDADFTGDTVNIVGHGFVDFAIVNFTAGTGSLPSPLVAGRDYTIQVVDANNIRVADTLPDRRALTFITPTPAGGTGHSIDETGLTEEAGIEYASNRETANSNGYARQTMPAPTIVLDTQTNQRVQTANITVTFTASGGNIQHSGVVVIVGGSTTYGSTTGVCDFVLPVVGPILDGVAQDFNIRVSSMRVVFNTVGSD